ncbi:MAG: dihydroneopterin aldolase [Vulcanimicrobiaceae bacterium]
MSEARDRIEIGGIRAYGRHGALAGERDCAQAFEIALVLEADLSAARCDDALAATIDYGALSALVVRIVAERSYRLLERLGDEILREILADPRVLRAQVTIAKPGVLGGATPAVTLHAARA